MRSLEDLREISYGSTAYLAEVELRRKVLRLPLSLDFVPSDFLPEPQEFHLGAFDGNQLIACLVLTPLGDSVKMRQVAVEPSAQGRGIGTRLVRFSEEFASHRGFTKMILSARSTAIPFYERLGYEVVGEPYEEVTIPHSMMERDLCGISK